MTFLLFGLMTSIIIVYFKLVQDDDQEKRLEYMGRKIECLEGMCKSLKDGLDLAMELIFELKEKKENDNTNT